MKKLFLLDGMALVYRAHFALIARPIFNSKGVNTSALFGFAQTVLDILSKQQPTHIAVAFDTDKPTQRHAEFAEYKATRQEMPEDLSRALPDVRRLLEAFRIPLLECHGYEADDIIGTLVRKAGKAGFTSYMVTPDKDFGQLVADNIFIYKPGRMGSDVEILGPKEVCARWGIARPEQVIDILALMGDASDNIPGVPGIGEKTAAKLIAQFGSIENLLAGADQITGKLKENIKTNIEAARMSKRLATLNCDAPCEFSLEDLAVKPRDDQRVKELFAEFEFNHLGKRLFGEQFRAPATGKPAPAPLRPAAQTGEFDFSATAPPVPFAAEKVKAAFAPAVAHQVASTPEARAAVMAQASKAEAAGVFFAMSPGDPRQGRLAGLAISSVPGHAVYFPCPSGKTALESLFEELSPLLSNGELLLIGHDLKPALALLKWHGFEVRARLFDTMIAQSLLDPEARNSLGYLSEVFLGHVPTELKQLVGVEVEVVDPDDAPAEKVAKWATERADLLFQLRKPIEAELRQKSQERVFYEIECPLIPVLVDMEHAGVHVDASVLGEFGAKLSKELDELETSIHRLADSTFNLNSPKQLGTVLFETLKICDAPKKTKTGQYATDEQTLLSLASDHEIVRLLLDYRAASKLKSTYVDALPETINPATGRIHTSYNQVATSTGRLNSQDPNLQNIPIRSDRGQEIRKAFVPAGPDYLLLSADYSQIELRIIAALSREAGLLEAFRTNVDVHASTAARVFGVFLEMVTPEMRRKAKMVNFGIAYGISAFGLSQRLGISRREAAEIIDAYFRQFPGIRNYMDETIEFARQHGYVETVTGRRRYIRDITSRNMTVRGSAERNAINAPIQGTAADMIKIAMIRIQEDLRLARLKSRMLLQVHDELVFDLYKTEEAQVRAILEEKMTSAIKLDVPIVVDIGTGANWLEAH